jgi:hypothetical protein
MSNEAIIGILGLISAVATAIGGASIGLAFKNQGRITTLEANAENHDEMIKEHKQESKDFRKALEQNTLAIHELTTLIKHKL